MSLADTTTSSPISMWPRLHLPRQGQYLPEVCVRGNARLGDDQAMRPDDDIRRGSALRLSIVLVSIHANGPTPSDIHGRARADLYVVVDLHKTPVNHASNT